MNSETEKLGRFSRAVYKVADEEAEKIMSEAYAWHDREIQKAGNDGLSLSYEKIKENVREINEKYIRMIASGELEGKRRVLLYREELAKKVFSLAKKKIEEFKNSPDYEKYLLSKAKTIGEEYKGKTGVIHICPDDKGFEEKLLSVLPGGFKTVTDSSIKLGGIAVYLKVTIFFATIHLTAPLKNRRSFSTHGRSLKSTDRGVDFE